MSDEGGTFSELAVIGGVTGLTQSSALYRMLMGDDIAPGSPPSYELCKTIYLYHPLGAKMVDGPLTLAQSQERVITVQDAPDEVRQAFLDEWEAQEADTHILNVHALARIYGISAIVLGVEGQPSNSLVDMPEIYKKKIFFNDLDPLNVAGSLVLSQQTSDPLFQKPVTIRTSGDTYHPSRFRVVMNERPIFISYTGSAFGFVGRSVFSRALYPLKSFIRSMIADDIIQSKIGALIAKMKSPGSIVNQVMRVVASLKRALLKRLQSGQVLSIDTEESIETLDMTHVDTAGTYSRNNIIRNIETCADMPAKMLDQETMVSGFGEGTEDARRYAQYIGRIRIKMNPEYKWFDNIIQYRAWNPDWYKRVIQSKYAEEWGSVDFTVAFSQWREAFHAEWPSLLIEPESEQIKKEEVKLEAVIAILNSLLTQLDPYNKTRLIEWASDCFGENRRLFPHELELDWQQLEDFQNSNAEKQDELHEAAIEPPEKNMEKFSDSLARLRDAAARLERPRPVAVAGKR